jgi:hypothetical protein
MVLGRVEFDILRAVAKTNWRAVALRVPELGDETTLAHRLSGRYPMTRDQELLLVRALLAELEDRVQEGRWWSIFMTPGGVLAHDKLAADQYRARVLRLEAERNSIQIELDAARRRLEFFESEITKAISAQ